METNCVSDGVCVKKKWEMSQKVQILRSLVEQRLTAAAEEIFGLFERTIAEYEVELCRTKEENQRQRQILDCVWNPTVQMHKTECPANVHQLSVVKKEVPPEQQEWSPSLDQDQDQDQEDPEYHHIEEEQEEPWIRQDGEQLGIQRLRASVKQPLDSDVLFKGTVAEYEEEICHSKKETATQQQLLVFKPKVQFHTTGHPADVHHQSVVKEEVSPEQQDWNPSLDLDLDQDLEDPEYPHIKEEQEDLWRGQEADRTKFQSTPVSVKNEDDEEKVYSSQLHQRQSKNRQEPVQENCESEPASSFHPHRHLQAHNDEQTEDSSEHDSVDSDFWKEVCERRTVTKSCEKGNDVGRKKKLCCPECDKIFFFKSVLVTHMRVHTGEKPFSCSICGKKFSRKEALVPHMKVHTGEKPFSCAECGKRFTQKGTLSVHMKLHTGEKPFSCSVCQKQFYRKHHVQAHMKIHTRE